jgi:hypothetical protein
MTVHHCPHCRCLPEAADADMGYVNRDAPFYPLVVELERASREKRR